jgi:hypothetical protein
MKQFAFFVLILAFTWGASAEVSLERVPGRGIQPQAVVDGDRTLHLLYFSGEPAGGDLYYVKRPAGDAAFTEPLRVNHHSESAVATGTIRGAHLALGHSGRAHVAWMGSGKAARKVEGEKHPRHPMLYARLNDASTGFESERDLMTWTGGLDGGGSIAADALGNVFVAWHGRAPDGVHDETGRAMYVAVSRDNGLTFAREVQANSEPTGSCGCCGMRAFVDARDRLHFLYRGANKTSRDMTLLTSVDHGKSFASSTVNQWFTQSCPMSSAVMANAGGGLLLATEVSSVIELSRVTEPGTTPSKLASVSPAKSKHPSLATNTRGEVLVAWAEGAGWAQGGRLKWRLFDADGKPAGEELSGGDLPAWSFPAAVSTGDGFLILH